MIIDEKREFCVSNFAQFKKNRRVIESDHNGLILELDIQFSYKKLERKEMFNLKNKECQEAFKVETEINQDLLKCFSNELPFQVESKQWLKTFNSILYKCFKKVRICESKKKKEISQTNLMKERINLKNETKFKKIDENIKQKINKRIEEIEN